MQTLALASEKDVLLPMKEPGGESLFDEFDFAELNSPDFKEDSVREEIVKPILDALGYAASGKYKIQRSKKLRHPFVKTASGKRKITIFPDYLFSVDNKYAWVLDAKAPEEEITTGENREQVYFYAIHPDVRVRLYALCNGKEFALFAVDESDPILYFQVSEIAKYRQSLGSLLSPRAFSRRPPKTSRPLFDEEFDYTAAKPLPEIVSNKQGAKRHFGVHGYFTRQPWNVVQEYIKNFTKPGDLVLDPYGGSGVTLVEALMLGRKAIHIDLNPLSEFIVKNLIQPIDKDELVDAFHEVCAQLRNRLPKNEEERERILAEGPYPKGVRLPKSSDVEHVEELFSRKQLAELALLKSLILKQKKQPIRGALLLMFSGLINKVNLTYHSSKGRSEGRGDSAVFRYYRYRLAPEPASIDLIKYFGSRLTKLLAAKAEMAANITSSTVVNAEINTGSATDLTAIGNKTVDYIYTDPPYGDKIPYLDLSTMWTAWLDLRVSDSDYALEAIEGGEHKRSKADYSQLIANSIREMYRVLKFDRWMSFVFQHKDPAYWHLIVETAEKVGFEYMGTVTQRVGQTSFKKRQNPFTVLHGQLIINFKKVKNPQALMKMELGYETTQLIMQFIEAIIARAQGATLEEIYNELIVRGMEFGFLDDLSREQHNVAALLRDHFDYNVEKHIYEIRKNTKFKTQIPLQVRIKYYLISYMKKMQRQDISPRFDDIILNIMPLLKNGITPEQQTIVSVLERAAEQVGDGRWRLLEDNQLKLNLIDALPVDAPKKAPRSVVPTPEVPFKAKLQ
jgi:DNA modification methylase